MNALSYHLNAITRQIKTTQSAMQRKPSELQNKQFDVLIIGGGSHGACAARDAALRGMSVALIDQGDICGATSHNSLKTIHGGIRYLQHLNFKRVLESIKEQKIWLRTAPHLVKPLPFLMPTYGHGARGPIAMFAGISLFRLFGMGRNKHLRSDRNLPAGSVMSKDKCLTLAPNIQQDKLSGGALWYDAQVEHADRAIMQIAEHANELGATVCNYIKATKLILSENQVIGVNATDMLNGESFSIQAKAVLNATGPWVSQLLKSHAKLETNISLVKSMNLVTSLPAPKVAMAVQSSRSSDSIVGDTKRLYFIVPWLGHAVVGTTHFNFAGQPDELSVDHQEILSFVDEINQAYPSLDLTAQDILYCYQGLAPEGELQSHSKQHDKPADNALLLHESKVLDHADEHKIEGLVSIFSVKWTTARLVAKHAIDMIASKIGNVAPCLTEHEMVVDQQALPFEAHALSNDELLAFCKAHIEHSMTVSISDLLLRRTNDTILGKLSFEQIKILANAMRSHFDWNTQQQDQQQQALLQNWLPNHLRTELENTPLWT